MEKWEMVRRFEQQIGGAEMCTATQFAKFAGLSDAYACKRKYLHGLDCVDKKYYVPDVIESYLSRKKLAE